MLQFPPVQFVSEWLALLVGSSAVVSAQWSPPRPIHHLLVAVSAPPPVCSLSCLWVNSQLTRFVMATYQSRWLCLQLTLPVAACVSLCVVLCVFKATHAQRGQTVTGCTSCQPGLHSHWLQRSPVLLPLSLDSLF